MWLWSAGPAFAVDLEVGGAGFPDLESALAVALPGDTLQLHGGTWFGSHLVDVDVTIEPWPGESPVLVPDASIPGTDPVLDGALRIGAAVTVRDLELDGQGAYRLARVLDSGLLTVDGVTVHDGFSAIDHGGCIDVESNGALVALDSTFRDCWSGEAGGALRVNTNADLTMTSSWMEGNDTDNDGGAIACNGHCDIDDTVFVRNHAVGDGGAIWGVAGGNIVANWICDNVADNDGGGIYLQLNPTVSELSYNVFANNAATNGGGVWTNQPIVAHNNDYLANEATKQGAAFIATGSIVETHNSITVGHTVGDEVNRSINSTPLLVDWFISFEDTIPLTGGGQIYLDGEITIGVDPMFVYWNPTDCLASDLRLREDSPALGTGDTIYDPNIGAFGACIAYPEVPADSFDQDCDGTELCYEDLDADGFGSTTTVATTDFGCAGVGLSTDPTDCDDDDDARFPGAVEVPADHLDSDCDGTDLCYPDEDHDGYGADTLVATNGIGCDAEGFASIPGDCDDTLKTVRPDADEVKCNDRDDDCDPDTSDAGPGCQNDGGGGGGGGDDDLPENFGGVDGAGLPRGWFCAVGPTGRVSGWWGLLAIAAMLKRRHLNP